jgi:acetolactate synthase, large subunit (EC 2.2.1.6)
MSKQASTNPDIETEADTDADAQPQTQTPSPETTSDVLPIETGADAVIRALENEGIEAAFGVQGGAIMPVYDALYIPIFVM